MVERQQNLICMVWVLFGSCVGLVLGLFGSCLGLWIIWVLTVGFLSGWEENTDYPGFNKVEVTRLGLVCGAAKP